MVGFNAAVWAKNNGRCLFCHDCHYLLVDILQKISGLNLIKRQMATLFQELSFLKNMSRNLPIPAFGSAHTFSAYRFSEDCRITFDGTF